MENLVKLTKLVVPVESIFSFFPKTASAESSNNYEFFIFFLFASFIIFFIVVFLTFYFSILYKEGNSKYKYDFDLNNISKVKKLEISLLFVFACFIFTMNFFSFKIFFSNMIPSIESKEIKIVGQKWNWSVNYVEENISFSGVGIDIGIKKNVPVKFLLTSQDVIHNFWLPNFSIKQDLSPGKYTTLYIKPNKVGVFPVLCAEFCGEKHSDMVAAINVMEENEYHNWIDNIKASNTGLNPIELGEKKFNDSGCVACHSIDGGIKIGPSLKGIYGKYEELETGEKILVNDDYIRQSLLEPQKQITKGFAPIMPSFQGQLSENEIIGIIEFIKSLK